MSHNPPPSPAAPASLRHGDRHSAIRLADTYRLPSPGRSFYLIRDWQTQCFQLSKKEELTAISGLVGPEQLTYTQYIDTLYPEDQAGFTTMEHRWQNLIAQQPSAQLPHYQINFDYRIKTRNRQTVRLLHQIVHLGIDESGIIRYSVERCTDISVWKRYGSMVLTLLGPAFVTPYHFRPDRSIKARGGTTTHQNRKKSSAAAGRGKE